MEIQNEPRTAILITGLKGSGKSTVADMLKKELGNKAFRVNVADPLKVFVYQLCKLFNYPINSFEDLSTPGIKERYRYFMQYIGTELCQRTFGGDCWVRMMITDSPAPFTIVGDLRFKHEFEHFHKAFDKCIIIKVNRDQQEPISKHVSERLDVNTLLSYSNTRLIEVDNNGSIEILEKTIRELITTI